MQIIIALVVSALCCSRVTAFQRQPSQFRSVRLHTSKLQIAMTNPGVKSLGSIARLEKMAAQLRAGLLFLSLRSYISPPSCCASYLY